MAADFIQSYNIDDIGTFSLVLHLKSIHALLFLEVNHGWSLHQLDISSAFCGDLGEQVFVVQPPRYVSYEEN